MYYLNSHRKYIKYILNTKVELIRILTNQFLNEIIFLL